MEYITITSDTYEGAVAEAKAKYGDRLRIHSRRDFTVGGGLFTKKRSKCEIICFLAEEKAVEEKVSEKELKEFEKEAKTPDPSTLSEKERHQTVLSSSQDEAEKLLDLNEIRDPLREQLLIDFDEKNDMALALIDRIIAKVDIDHKKQAHPDKYMVFLGPTGSGKTTTLAKIASLYQAVGKKVAIFTLDSYRVGAYEQVKAFADAFHIPVELIRGEDEVLLAIDRYGDYDLVLIDTMGISPQEGALNLKLRGLLSQFPKAETMNVLVSAANLKAEDLLKQYRFYSDLNISSLIVTKLDETESIGSFLSFSYRIGKPLLFCTNGQMVPEDIKKASTTVIIEYLKGFGIDVNRIAAQLSGD